MKIIDENGAAIENPDLTLGLLSILGTFCSKLTKHHFRMLCKISID